MFSTTEEGKAERAWLLGTVERQRETDREGGQKEGEREGERMIPFATVLVVLRPLLLGVATSMQPRQDESRLYAEASAPIGQVTV